MVGACMVAVAWSFCHGIPTVQRKQPSRLLCHTRYGIKDLSRTEKQENVLERARIFLRLRLRRRDLFFFHLSLIL
ncbi:uncharacterized protein B0H18DRAFT_979660 [Fomitopsis serialis]|uniref:uncharacterized protein n=1 Tax=Fomitopsis serialis TaxID=139415 RepID=UPI0020076EB4|nr:uncharacterized protein B0H18DRAFT_979660 [Neoantrodia serialis]KAH9934141.1 hypothetical protein B0H18DRAFT_979660 [Neoantrodia serialis]